MIKKITDKDKKDWLKFVKSTERLENKDSFNKKQSSVIKEKSIDLHGCSQEDANKTINNFIMSCYEQNVSKITVITGKGSRSKNRENPYQSKDLSILKYSVPNYIKDNQNLMKKILKLDFDSVKNPSKGNFDIILKKKSG